MQGTHLILTVICREWVGSHRVQYMKVEHSKQCGISCKQYMHVPIDVSMM